jgi:hypothetical protein
VNLDEMEVQKVVRANGIRPIRSQRFLFRQGRRIEESDQAARKEGESMLDAKQGTESRLRKRS